MTLTIEAEVTETFHPFPTRSARYVGRNPRLRGATATIDTKNKKFQLDRYPGGPRADHCNPSDHPLVFGWHDMNEGDWELT